MEEEGEPQTAINFQEVYNKMRMHESFTIIASVHTKQHKVTFQGNTLEKWIHMNRRVGKPRRYWAETTGGRTMGRIKTTQRKVRALTVTTTTHTRCEH